jgi:hypothetical protein
MMTWTMLHPQMTPAHLGYLPGFLSDADPRPAAEQIDDNYRHGGGWHKFEGFAFDPKRLTLKYPGDPTFRALAMTSLRDETLYFFDHSWLLILQKDGAWEVARLD